MDDTINLASFKESAPIIKLSLSQKEVDVRVFFNMNCCQEFIEDSEESGDYRIAFAKSVYSMYVDTCEPQSPDCTQDDFLALPDTELLKVLDCVLSQDERVKATYDEMICENPYERFYHANMKVLKSATAGISKSLEQINKTLQGFRDTYSKMFTTPTLSALESLKVSLSSVAVPKIEIPETLSLFADITQRFHFDTVDILNNIKPAFSIMQDSISNLFASIDFSRIAEYDQWTKQRKILVAFGWQYSNEIPEVILDEIYDKKDSITQEEVNTIITGYFRENRCKALKRIIKKWRKSPYFKSRNIVFHEALVNHSLKYYNTSTTLFTIHTEGVISDFVRLNFQPRYKVSVAIEDIKNYVEESSNLSLYEYSIYNDILESIYQAFVEGFDCTNPDSASNKSRDKLAHGHVTEKVSEVDSLQRILYLNEVFNLLQTLDEELENQKDK